MITRLLLVASAALTMLFGNTAIAGADGYPDTTVPQVPEATTTTAPEIPLETAVPEWPTVTPIDYCHPPFAAVITIPSVPGVIYWYDGEELNPGDYHATPGVHNFIVTPAPGYEFATGNGGTYSLLVEPTDACVGPPGPEGPRGIPGLPGALGGPEPATPVEGAPGTAG